LEHVVFLDIETTGLDPFNSQIVTIQVRSEGETKIWPVWESSEVDVIKSFLSFTDHVYRRGTRFVGYNILKFDVTYLAQRMQILGLMDETKWARLWKDLNWFDMYQFLGDEFGKFRQWKLGLTKKNYASVTNVEIPEFYSKREHAKILGYIQDEMQGMEEVYDELQKEPFFQELMKLRRDLLK
jgi:DNA polymerase elongation subunit (family B)